MYAKAVGSRVARAAAATCLGIAPSASFFKSSQVCRTVSTRMPGKVHKGVLSVSSLRAMDKTCRTREL